MHYDPTYGIVKVHPHFATLQEERRKDPFCPQDELTLNDCTMKLDDQASATIQKMV